MKKTPHDLRVQTSHAFATEVLRPDDRRAPQVQAQVAAGLSQANLQARPEATAVPLELAIFDGQKTIAGLVGRIAWQWLRIDQLWVDPSYRGLGMARDLLDLAESAAVQAGCLGVHLDTFDFQAPGLYARRGYRVFGSIEDQPPGARHDFLVKHFDSRPPSPPCPTPSRNPTQRDPMTVHVQTATPADLDAVAPLFDAYRGFYGRTGEFKASRQFIAARLQQGDSTVLLAREGGPFGSALGFTQLHPSFSSVGICKVLVLNDLFVTPSARGLGVGQALLTAAQSHARLTGAARLVLETAADNQGAQRLYA